MMYFDQQPDSVAFRRRPLVPPAVIPERDDDSAPSYPLIVPFKEGWAVQPWQPPATILRANYKGQEAVARGDDGNEAKEITVYQVFGFPVQDPQPPTPIISTRLRSSAIARGNDGIDGVYTYVPPFARAPRNLIFPNQQSNPAGAIPSYDAGAQVGAINSAVGITAPVYLKQAPGYLFTVIVVVAGTAAGAVYDYAGTGPIPSSSNEIGPIPTTTGPVKFDWPCQQGIFLVPGAGQVLAAKWT